MPKRTAAEIAASAAEQAAKRAAYEPAGNRRSFAYGYINGVIAMAIDVGRPSDGALVRELRVRAEDCLAGRAPFHNLKW